MFEEEMAELQKTIMRQEQMMKKFFDSIQPVIDQCRETAETLKRLKDWLDKNS